MLPLLFFSFAQTGSALPTPANDTVGRFERFMRAHPKLTVSVDLTVSNQPATGKGTYRMIRPRYLDFRMKWGPSDYSFTIADTDIVAVERGSKIYREYGDIGSFFMPDPDISQTPYYAFPMAHMAGTLIALIPTGVQFRPDGKATVAGASTDKLRASWQTQTGTIAVNAYVDAEGKLLQTERIVSGSPGITVKSTFKDYKLNPALAPGNFSAGVPAGFVPETLPSDPMPLNTGERMPWDGWRRTSGNGDLKSFASNKVLFLAIGAPDCEVSQKAARAVDNLGKQIAEKGGMAAALSLSSSASQAPAFRTLPNFFDPSGKAIQKLRAPGTPMFLMVAPNGMVTRIWYGFDNAKVGPFVSDVLDWVAKSKDPGKPPPDEEE